MRWGKVIGQAGGKVLSIGELERLQQIIIENSRFIEMGIHKEGGFVGEHDRSSGEPIPDHISVKKEDIAQLLNDLINTNTIHGKKWKIIILKSQITPLILSLF
jgi:hypothetical protein